MPILSRRAQSALVVVLSALALAVALPAATVGWADRGTWGINGNFVRQVAPGSPAEAAGILPGDRVRFGALPFTERVRLFYPTPGLHITVPVERSRPDGTVRTVIVSMTAGAAPVNATMLERWLTVLEFVTYLAFIGVGATLVYLRPSPMTWWLWAYCLSWVPIEWIQAQYALLPSGAFTALFLILNALFAGAATLPLLPFLLRFPHDRLGGWRARWRGPIVATLVAGYAYYTGLAFWRLSDRLSRPQIDFLDAAPASALFMIASVMLLVTFWRSEGNEKPRLRWAVFGMLFSFFAMCVSYAPVEKPLWIKELGATLSVTMPLSIAYATLRHRLLDVRFVVNNAVVVGAIATLLIAIISLIDFAMSHLVADYHLTLGIEAAITIGLGFALDRLHRTMRRAAERVFFRSRLIATDRLRRVRGALVYASRDETIESSLVDEPTDALSLASAALFRRGAQGGYERTHALGWDGATLERLDDDDALVRTLRFERQALDPHEVWSAPEGVPLAGASPVLAVPLFARETLEGLVLYGAHRDETEIDPGEIELLSSLCEAAAAAFDHVAFERSQQTISELRSLLAAGPKPRQTLVEGLPPLA
jgi:hypothetical protein